MASPLAKLVIDKIRSLPAGEACEFFREDEGTIAGWSVGNTPIPLSAVEKVFDPTRLMNGGEIREGRKVCLLLPSYKTMHPATAFSIMSFFDRRKMQILLDFGDAFIAHSRNKLACGFLRSTCEWALTLDDDMILPGKGKWFNQFCGFDFPEEFSNVNPVDRLLSHGKTLVGALYFGRWRHGKPVFAEGIQPEEERAARAAPVNLLKPTKWVGTGALMIHRTVFTDIEKKFPHLARGEDGNGGNWFTSSEHDLRAACEESLKVLADTGASETARITQAERLIRKAQALSKQHSSLGTGEDVQFCVRATQAGHQPFVDFGLVAGHVGNFVFGPKKV